VWPKVGACERELSILGDLCRSLIVLQVEQAHDLAPPGSRDLFCMGKELCSDMMAASRGGDVDFLNGQMVNLM